MTKVITYGTFDLFHEGHYNLLKRAKELGDYLIVGITTESYDISRGKLGVVDDIVTRIDNVRATGFVDKVIIEDHGGQKIEDVQKYGVDIFTVGSDWVGTFDYMNDYCKVVYLERTKGVSSSMIRETERKVVKLGIIGSGRIARRMVPEVRLVSGINVECVYNPHLESAQSMVDEYELAKATDDMDDLLSRVDAIYIASPHNTHYKYAKKALENGKHVLCEKPMTFRKSEAEELYALAKKNGVILMEAVKTAYCPGFVQMMNVAGSGAIGKIRDVEACFTRLTPKNIRELTDVKFGGSFTELATYSMLPIFKLMGTDYKDVRFDSVLADNGLDLYTRTSFVFDKGFGTCKNGLGVKSEGQLIISGTEGYILAESPWWLTKKFEVRYEDPNKRDVREIAFLGSGLRYEISDFVAMINGSNQTYKFTPEESIAMAGVMEKFVDMRLKGKA